MNLIKLLDNQEVDRAAGFRVKNLKKAQLIICDEIGYTPISRAQANRFFTFVSDTYSDIKDIVQSVLKKTVLKEKTEIDSIDYIMGVFLFHHHGNYSMEEAVKYVTEHGMTQKQIPKYFAETAPPSRVNFRQIRGWGYRPARTSKKPPRRTA